MYTLHKIHFDLESVCLDAETVSGFDLDNISWEWMDAGVVRQFFALEYWKTRPIVSSVGQASGLAVSSLRVPSVLNLRSSSMPAGSAPPVLSLGSSSVAAEPTFSMNVNLGFSSMVA